MSKSLPTKDTQTAVRAESLPTPADKTERRELRSKNSKTFVHPERTDKGEEIRTCEVRMGAVCYCSDDGELRSIDTTIRDLGDSNIGVEWAPYKMHLHETGIGFDFWSRDGGWVGVTLSGIGGEKFDQDTPLKPDIDGNTITFTEVRPGCDIVFRCLNQRVKTLRILRDADAPRAFDWSVASDKPELVDSTLTGTDAAGNQLELLSEAAGDVIHETWTGMVKVRLDPTTRIKSLSDDVAWPVEIDPTVNYSITSPTANDGYEFVLNGSPTLWSGYTSMFLGSGNSGNFQYNPGFRFLAIAVPRLSTITAASLAFDVRNVYGYANGTIYGRATDNPPVWDSTPNNPFSVSKTSATTGIVGLNATGVATYDIAAIVQEKVDSAGWVSGHALAIPLIGGIADSNAVRIYTYEEDFFKAATLSITYTPPHTAKLPIIHSQAVQRAASW